MACPYSAYVSTATRECQDGAYCIVDSACKTLKAFTTKDFVVDKAKQSRLVVRDLVVSHVADLPNAFVGLKIRFFNTYTRSVGDLSTTSNVNGLEILDNETPLDLSRVVWPTTLEIMTIENTQIVAFPATPLPKNLHWLTLSNTSLTNVQHLDMSTLWFVNFELNPLTALYNVTFGEGLQQLNFGKANLTTFTVDPGTYDVLRNESHAVYFMGALDITATCKVPNRIMPLVPNGPEIFTAAARFVCVAPGKMLPPPTPSSVPTTSAYRPTSMAPPTTDSVVAAASGLSGVAIAGIAAGAVILILGIGLYFFCRRRRPSSPMTTSKPHESSHPYEGGTATAESRPSGCPPAKFDDLAMLRLESSLLLPIACVAEGAYGQVWRGTYQGHAVAIKGLLPGKNSRSAVEQFANEILLASRMSSPYIVATMGASWRVPFELQMVLEWMDRGDLRGVLQATAPPTPDGDASGFPWDEKMACMLSMAEGLAYLHSLDIIHRDFKSRNVLLDSTKGTKITDFGTSRETTTDTMTFGVGTYRWMAPEILLDIQYSTAADIYSFGVVLSELSTHEIPYSDQRNTSGHPLVDTAIMGRVMTGSIRPSFGTQLPLWVRHVADACIAWSPEARPTALEVAHTIRQQIRATL